MLVTGQKAVAEHYGVDVRTVRYWVERSDFPKAVNGQFDLEKIDQWRASQPQMTAKDGKLGEANAALSLQLKQAKLETEREKALKARREREELEGELLSRRVWEAFAARLLAGVGDWAEGLADVLEPHLPKRGAAKILKVLNDEIRRKRDELAEQLKKPVRD